MSQAQPRPRDVVTSATLTIVGSAMALVMVFSSIGQLRSSEMRREIEAALNNPRVDGLGLEPAQIMDWLQAGAMVLAACSVTAIVLAVYVLRRHRPSRIALTVLGSAVAVVSVAAGWQGLLLAGFIWYAVWLLWKPDSRAWFREESMSADRPSGNGPEEQRPDQPEPRPDRPESRQDRPEPQPWSGFGQPHGGPRDPGERPSDHSQGHEQSGGQGYGQGYGQEYGQGYGPPAGPGYGQGYGPGYRYGTPGGYGQPSGYPSPYGSDAGRRPGVVVGSLIMTWVGVAFMLLISLGSLAFAGSRQVLEAFEAEIGSQGLSIDQLATVLRVVAVVLLLLALLVGTLSVFAWRRANWARIALTVVGTGYCAVQLFALVTGQVMVIFAIIYVAAAVMLLWLPAARAWYAGQTSGGPGGPGGPGGYGGYGGPGGYGGQGGYPPQPPRQQPW